MRLTLLARIILLMAGSGGTPTLAAIATSGVVSPAYDSTDPWMIGGPLFVGGVSGGTLTIDAGSSVVDTGGIIADAGNTSGTVTVTGTGSTWTNNGMLRVGARGEGKLTIADGGTVTNTTNGFVGSLSGSTGTDTVTGTGSTWTNTGGMRVGSEGDGTLTISAGGSVANTTAGIGRFSSSTGMATVTGAGSIWTNSGALFVGDEGDGTLTIAAGGSVANTTSSIGRVSGSTGAVTVTGTGSTWDNSGQLSIGDAGTGALAISDGGSVSSSDGIIGARGAVTVSGGGSTWTVTGFFQIGGGNGTLAIGIGGATEHGSLSASGAAQLAGLLQLALIDSFVPDSMDTFNVLSADGGIAGEFSNVTNGQRLDTVDGIGSFLVHYGAGSAFPSKQIVLTSFELAPNLPGDYNGNGMVDAADYPVWRKNIGAPAGTLPNDVDGGLIGEAQYNTWKANFGNSLPGGESSGTPQLPIAVPEPASFILLFALAIASPLPLSARRSRLRARKLGPRSIPWPRATGRD